MDEAKMFESLSIEDAFVRYMKQANPKVEKRSAQYRESRRVFFAGVATLYFHTLALAGLPEVVGIAELKSIDEQLEEFMLQLKKGQV